MGGERHRRPGRWDRVRETLQLLVGLTGELVKLIDVIRNIR